MGCLKTHIEWEPNLRLVYSNWASNMFQGGGGASSVGGSSSGSNGGAAASVMSVFNHSPDNASTLWTNHGNSWEKYVQYTYNGPGELVTPESYIVKFDYQWNQNNKNSGNVITQRSYDVFQNNTSGSTGSNNFIPDLGINTALTANGLSGGGFSSLLEKATTANATAIYKYGTHTTSATALTAQNSARMLRIAGVAKFAGNAFAVGGGVLSIYQYSQGQINGNELAADLVFTAVGVFFPGAGTIINIAYFGGKEAYKYIYGESPF